MNVSRLVVATSALGALLAPCYLAPPKTTTPAPGPKLWQVTVTNVTRGQIFSPPVVAVHTDDMTPLWHLGEPASPELAGVAEDAMNQPLIDAIQATGEAKSVQVLTGINGPILPGETASIVVSGKNGDLLSMAGMLVITNDAFFGLNGVQLPKSKKDTDVRFSRAYDAGSEANNELCAFIPGPPCGSVGVRMTTGAEGYVHVHAGVHGIGDLTAAEYDWRGEVARITVRRLD